MLSVKGVFSLYLSIYGLQKGPRKFLTGSLKVLEKSWIFSSERVGTLDPYIFELYRFKVGSFLRHSV